MTVAGFALLLAALSVALWLYTLLTADRPAEYSAEQQSAARSTACAAYTTVSTGVATNTNLASPGGAADVAGSLAVAANARVSLIGGGQYLLARIDAATPAELADPLRDFGNSLLDFGAAATAGALNTDPPQTALLQRIDGLDTTLRQLCA